MMERELTEREQIVLNDMTKAYIQRVQRNNAIDARKKSELMAEALRLNSLIVPLPEVYKKYINE